MVALIMVAELRRNRVANPHFASQQFAAISVCGQLWADDRRAGLEAVPVYLESRLLLVGGGNTVSVGTGEATSKSEVPPLVAVSNAIPNWGIDSLIPASAGIFHGQDVNRRKTSNDLKASRRSNVQ